MFSRDYKKIERDLKFLRMRFCTDNFVKQALEPEDQKYGLENSSDGYVDDSFSYERIC